MPVRAIVLTGAPRPNTLNWDDDSNPALLQHSIPFITPLNSSTCESPIRWRSLVSSSNNNSHPASKADDDDDDDERNNQSLFTGGKIDRYSGLILDETLSEFYEHSFALHEGLSQSQSQIQSEGGSLSFRDVTTTSLYPSSHESSSSGKPSNTTPGIGIGHLSDLEDLPDAQYLWSISPRTVTVNLIVAIIHISARRRVRTRWGREADIVEVLVADETSSGFRVTCWLPPSPSDNAAAQTPLEKSLANLRPRDIALFRCVALTSFRQRVYGQSMRYDMTRIDLLSRRPLDLGDSEGVFKWKTVVEATDADNTPDRQLRKVRRVRQWIMNFIGPTMVDGDSEGSSSGDKEAVKHLPPDTQ